VETTTCSGPLSERDTHLSMFGGIHFSPDAPDADNITRMDLQTLPIISDMHRYGIRLDVPFLQSLSRQIANIKEMCEVEVSAAIGNYQYRTSKNVYEPFKIGSRDHLSQLFFQHLKIQGDDPVPMTEKGKRFEVSEEVLKPFTKRHQAVAPVIEWHSAEKLRNTYTDPLQLLVDSDHRLHTSFNVTIAATGRLSSSNPNLQNIPVRTELGKQIRNAFIASPGCQLFSSDLSQIEMLWAAHRSQDPVMMDVFLNKQDIHTRTACIVFGLDYEETMTLKNLVEFKRANSDQVARYSFFKQFQRLPCKTVGFGVLYGQTSEGLQASLASEGLFWTEAQCQQFIDKDFFAAYPRLKDMLERDYSRALRYAMIWCDFGRVRLVPEAKSQFKRIRNEGTRKAGNHPEQSGAQGTCKVAMAELCGVYRDYNKYFRCVPLLQIHDQIIGEADKSIVREVADITAEIMRNATPLSIPIQAEPDVGERWGDL